MPGCTLRGAVHKRQCRIGHESQAWRHIPPASLRWWVIRGPPKTDFVSERAALLRNMSSVSEKTRKLKAKKKPFAPSPSSALVNGPLYQLRRWKFKRVTILIAADEHDVWCLWGESLRLPIACIREISITKLHALEFRIDTFVNGTHVFRAPQRPGALHYWVATLQALCAQCMEPASRWQMVWAVSRVQARWRGLLGRKRAEMEQRKRAEWKRAEAERMSAAKRNQIANQAAQIEPTSREPSPRRANLRDELAQVAKPSPKTHLQRSDLPLPPPPPSCRCL